MDQSYLYTGLKKKQKVFAPVADDSVHTPRLESLFSSKIKPTPDILIKCYINELKYILDIESLPLFVQKFINFAENWEDLISNSDFEFEDDLPSTKNYYEKLGPLMMRSILSSFSEDSHPKHIQKNWMETLRVSIEEDLYDWQDRIK